MLQWRKKERTNERKNDVREEDTISNLYLLCHALKMIND
jgi:hypothetical protein